MNPELCIAGNLAQDIVYDESFWGGSAGNIAINASFFNLKSSILSNLGKDDFSIRYLDYLKNIGVSTELIQNNLSTIPQCIVSSSLNHSIAKDWVDNGATEALEEYSPTQEQRNIIYNSKIIHITTVPSKLARVLVSGKGSGNIVGYEPGPKIDETDHSFFDLSVFKNIDYLFLNEEERDVVDDTVGLQNIRNVMNKQQLIIVTLGDKGCALYSKDTKLNVDQPNKLVGKDMIDSSGAGDAFKTGFYIKMLQGADPVESSRVANAFGATIVGQIGAILTASNVDYLKRFL